MAKTGKKDPSSKGPAEINEPNWIPAERDYALGLVDGKLVCRNPSGKILSSLPPWLKESDSAQQILALCDWLDDHAMECLHAVELWMLRSLTVPTEIIYQVWQDPDWRRGVENMVVAPSDGDGHPDLDNMGILKNIDSQRGLGVVDVDGETKWLKHSQVLFPHPILIGELDDLRELANELNLVQSIEQLYRPIYVPSDQHKELGAIREFEGGKFQQLNFALGVCRRLGYPVRGGYATCRVWEGTSPLEARYYVGSESPELETETGELIFVRSDQRAVMVRDVGPVTFSEGMRMAAAIYAKRKVEEQAS